MVNFNKVLEINEEDYIARVQCGIYGPELDNQLKKKDLL